MEIVENQEEAETRERHEGEARQREIEDLIAQQGMNAATQEMNGATQSMRGIAFYSAIVATIGTLLLGITLLLMTRANRAAVDAANAAIEANQTLRQEKRPWLDFSVLDWGSGQLGDGDDCGNIAAFPKVKIENVGKSLARSVVFGTRVFQGQSFTEEEAIAQFVSERRASGQDSRFVVFPDKDFVWSGWRDMHRIRSAKMTGDESNPVNWWFVSLLTYWHDGQMFYTHKMYSMPEPSPDQLILDEHGGHRVDLSGIVRWDWKDGYE